MTSMPQSVSSVTVGPKKDHNTFTRLFASNTCRLRPPKRSISRFSWANAFTTRMPGIVSANTFTISAHAALVRAKPWRSRTRTLWANQAMSGKGKSVTNASDGSILNKIAAVITIISTSVQKSSRLTERNVQMRSVSLPTREIKSPVRFPPKNSSDKRCRWAYVSLRKSALICSLTRESTYVLAQLNSQASAAEPNNAARYHGTTLKSTASPLCCGIRTLSNNNIVRYGHTNPAAVLASVSAKPKAIIVARGRANRPSRQSERTGGGAAAGKHNSQTVCGGSNFAPQDGQMVADNGAGC